MVRNVAFGDETIQCAVCRNGCGIVRIFQVDVLFRNCFVAFQLDEPQRRRDSDQQEERRRLVLIWFPYHVFCHTHRGCGSFSSQKFPKIYHSEMALQLSIPFYPVVWSIQSCDLGRLVEGACDRRVRHFGGVVGSIGGCTDW